MRRLSFKFIGVGLLVGVSALSSANAVAGYYFNNTLASNVGGAPDLVAVNNFSYGTAFLYGQNRSIATTDGATGFANNAGFTLDNSGLNLGGTYSFETLVSFQTVPGWRKILDVSSRANDAGLYVDPASKFAVFPVVSGQTTIAANTFYHLVLTVSGGVVNGYLNGGLEFTGNTNVMDASAANPFSLFLDDSATGGGEYSNVSVGIARFYNTALTADEVSVLAANPYGNAPVPEPASMAALALGVGALIRRKRNS